MSPLQNTSETIRKTYFERFDELELEYQLHFASRLAAWNNDTTARDKLAAIRPLVMPDTHEERQANLQGIVAEIAAKDFERDVNNYAQRKPYFETYPQLLTLHNALFRIRHWYCIYDTDERGSLFNFLSQDSIRQLITKLSADTEALRVLSTYAINTLYLYDKLYSDQTLQPIDVKQVIGLKQSYDTSKKKDLQLLIYLYTHCILGETLFYYQPVEHNLPSYLAMLEELEGLIGAHYDDISLDNKLEFLVCARICNFTSEQATRIYDETLRSVNSEGFIVDMHNNHINEHKQSFMMSEHRNVLFILSCSEFRPSVKPALDAPDL